MVSLLEMGFSAWTALALCVLILVPMAIVFLLMPKWLRTAKARGWIGKDIHKVDRPEVPESGGVVLSIAYIVGILVSLIFFTEFTNQAWTLLMTVGLAGIIGFIDDRKRLSPILKIVSSVIAGAPLLLANLFQFITLGRPIIPVLGIIQLTILYPLATPFLIAATSNTVNQLEGYNGEGAGTCVIVGIVMCLAGIIQNSATAVYFSLPFIAATAAFLFFNKYPSRVFPGDTGTLSMGAMIGGVMILGGIEIATLCALLAHIFNSFYVIISVRGFRESHTIKKKDIIITENNQIQASAEERAPITLPRLLLAYGALTEPTLVQQFWKLSFMAGCFGVIAAFATLYTSDPGLLLQYPLLLTFICVTLTCVLLFSILFWKNLRLRSITLIMIVFLGIGLCLLIVIDTFIAPLGNPWNLLLAGMASLPLIALWYFLQKRLFLRTLARYKATLTKAPK